MTHKLIPLTKGKFVKVSSEDFEYLSQFKWSYQEHHSGGYAKRGVTTGIRYASGKFKVRTIDMHREIMNAQKGQQVDHVNFDRLDNTRENLRLCNANQNTAHRRVHKNSKSGYKGVWWIEAKRKWIVMIKKDHKYVFNKAFFTLKDAVDAYNEAVIRIHGEFAVLQPYNEGRVL